MTRTDKAHRVLNRALARYDRRAAAYNGASLDAPIPPLWLATGTSALALVKQARDLAGRLEVEVYDNKEVQS